MGITVGGLDLENTLLDLENRDIESSSTEIVDGNDLVLILLETVCKGSSSWLVNDTENIETSDLTGVLGGLTLLTVTLYLVQEKRNFWCTLVPMLFMLVTTLTAMGIGIKNYIEQESYLLLFIGSLLVLLALWVIVEGLIRFAYERRLITTGDG